ncbi:MAG TPA: hypothetical protein PK629_05155 [Oscillospiraceae bacterium]|nr:hypothetical protein [Oscillospiraceae bacterium]HPF56590.1 hypothetical protein [Clostridiales bacterium]HPK36498.1 hypothetical protein [Oscillospiraceae bacterium]HPR76442.1 hypothetical protein [Oscillospiraceae bacterium]
MSRKLTSQEAAGETLEHLDYTPLTFWQRVGESIIDHWKILLILLLAAIGVVLGFIQLKKEPAPDIKVTFISSAYVLPEDTADKLQELLISYTKDVNKDSAQYAKVFGCYYDKDNTGANPEATALTQQMLDDNSCYIIFADPDSYAWLVENGYVSKLGEFDTNRSDIEPDALGFLISDSNIFGYINNSNIGTNYNNLLGYVHDDYGLSYAFADFYVVFKTGEYDELTGDALIAYQAAVSFYETAMSTIITTTSAE